MARSSVSFRVSWAGALGLRHGRDTAAPSMITNRPWGLYGISSELRSRSVDARSIRSMNAGDECGPCRMASLVSHVSTELGISQAGNRTLFAAGHLAPQRFPGLWTTRLRRHVHPDRPHRRRRLVVQ